MYEKPTKRTAVLLICECVIVRTEIIDYSAKLIFYEE